MSPDIVPLSPASLRQIWALGRIGDVGKSRAARPARSTDVYTWKILRRDRDLDRPTTEQRIHRLVSKLIP